MYRPLLEAFEDRTLPSTVNWTGASGVWSVAANWTDASDSSHHVPGAGDDAVISTAVTVTHNSTDSVQSVSVTTGTLEFTGGALTVSTTVSGSGPYNLRGGGLTGAQVASGTTLTGVNSGSTLNGVILNAGSTLDLTTVNGIYVYVQNGLTVNDTGTVKVGNSGGTNYGQMLFTNTQTLGGTGSVVLGGSTNDNMYLNAAGISVTLGSGLTIHSTSGQFSSASSNSNWLNQTTIAADGSGGTITINSPWTNSNGGFSAVSGEVVNISNTVTNTSSTLTLSGAGKVQLTGGTISGGTVNGTLIATTSGGTLNGVTLGGTLDLTNTSGNYVYVQNGMTVNGTVNLGNSTGTVIAGLYFTSTGILGGTGSILFGGSTSDSMNLYGTGITVTLASSLTIHGKSGQITLYSGSGNWLNQTTIAADVSGGTISLYGAWANGNAGFSAASGATINIYATITNTSSTLTVTETGTGIVELVSSGTIIGGTVNGTLTVSSGVLNGVTLGGTLDLATLSGNVVYVTNGLTVHGTVNVGNTGGTTYGRMFFQNTETIGGTGGILFGGSSSNELAINVLNSVVTLGSNLTVHGKNGYFYNNTAFGTAWVNLGTIAADTPGGVISLQGTWNGSNGTFSASAGTTLNVQCALNNAGNTFTASGAGIVQLVSAIINGGTLAGTLVGTYSSYATLKGVTIAGTLDLATNNGAAVYVRNGLTVNGAINIGNAGGGTYGGLNFSNTQTVSGTGTITFGGNASNNNAMYIGESDATVTLASGLTFHGKTGYFGGSDAATEIWVNQTTIAADVAGGTITLNNTWTGSTGVFSASTGAFINFNCNYNNSGNTLGLAGSGKVQLVGGSINGGTISGTLTGYSNGTLSGVTISGTLDMTTVNGANVWVANGITVNGTVNLGAADASTYAYMRFTNTQTVGGTGSIVFGGSTSNYLQTYNSNTVVTLGPNLTVHGKNGYFNTTPDGSAWVNQGTITDDISAGTIYLDGAWIGDGGTFSAANGGTLSFYSSNCTYTNTGATLALSGSGQILLQGATIIGGTISGPLIGTSSNGYLDGVTIAGNLDLATFNNAYVYVLDGLTVNGTVNIGATDGSTFGGMYFLNTLTVGGTGNIVFGGSTSTNNVMQVYYPNSTVTLGSGLTVHGKNGYLNVYSSYTDTDAWVNQGTIAADVSGGTLTLSGTWTNNGTFKVQNGGTLLLQNTPTNSSGTTLAGGTWQVFAGSTLRVPLSSGIVTSAATILLDGAASNFYQATTGTTDALAGFATNAAAVSFTIRNGRNFTTVDGLGNAGSVTVGSSSTLTITGAYTQTAGSTTFSSGTLTASGGINIAGGSLAGPGTINGNLSNSGTVSPASGTSTGSLTVNGTYTQAASASLNIKLGGTAAGAFDQLTVSGLATLNGTLNVSLVNSFTPADGNNFQILSFGSESGDFSTRTGFQIGSGIFIREALHATDVTLNAFQAVFLFQQQPTNTTAGQAVTPAVQVAIADPLTSTPIAFDNTDTVTMAIGTNPSGGTLSGTLTATVSGGVATFNNLSIDKAGTGYTLTASTSGMTTLASNGFNITPAAAHHLVITQQPSNTVAGQSISPAVTVAIVDQFGNVETGDNTDTVTMAIGTNPGGGTLSGTLTVMVSGGVATFSNLWINKTGSGYTLTASSSGLIGSTSNGFAITPAAADHLVFLQQPTNTAAGATITPALTVAVVDQFGNVVTGDNTDTVTISIGSNPTGGTLSGTFTVTVVNGIATFSDLSIDLAGDGYTLHATFGSLTAADSGTFSIT
jgi:hypothetical protein